MSMFQCERCGCAENTALSHGGSKRSQNYDWSGMEEWKGKMLCSACAPAKYNSGIKSNLGVWHGAFVRVFLPKGMFFTTPQGDLAHKETGDTNFQKYALLRDLDEGGEEVDDSEIIATTRIKLSANGFDGLYCDSECACELEDIAPCGMVEVGSDYSYINGCKPGYKHVDPRPASGGNWIISCCKEPMTDADWESVHYG